MCVDERLELALVRPIATPAPGITPISVVNGQTQTKPAGAYGAVTVQGTLELSGGVYDFASLTLGNDAKLKALAAAEVVSRAASPRAIARGSKPQTG